MAVASIMGVWLFSLQHRFETAHWTARGDWTSSRRRSAARRGCDLPRPLHWLTGNIGFHHVHHLDPRVPNYRLRAAHEACKVLHPMPPLTLGPALAAPLLTLWDERRAVWFASATPRLERRQRDPVIGRIDPKGVGLFASSPTTPLRPAMAERGMCSRPQPRGARMKDWLVPPVLFPLFLILLVVVYAMLRTPI